MEHILSVFATGGIAAVLWRLLRTALRALGLSADAFLAGELVEARANRGDLTGLAEARARADSVRRARVRALLGAGAWLAVAVVPALLLPHPAAFYAGCSILWFLPGLSRHPASSNSRTE